LFRSFIATAEKGIFYSRLFILLSQCFYLASVKALIVQWSHYAVLRKNNVLEKGDRREITVLTSVLFPVI